MKRIILSFIIISIVSVSLIGCNSDTKNNSQTSAINSANSIEATASEKYKPQTYSQIGHYNDGLAWVKNDKYWGCIDKKGKMQFQYNSDEIDSSPDFENAYAYLETKGGQVFVINKSGDIVGNFDNPVAYGYGYAVVENHYSDFDSAYYEYVIYNPDQKQVQTYKTEKDSEITVRYCGDGVFYFEEDAENIHLFFSKKDKWIKYNYIRTSNVDNDIEFNNGLAFTTNDSYSLTKTFVVINADGEITEIDARDEKANYYEKYDIFGAKRENNLIYGNSVVFYDEEEQKLSSYNIINDSFSDFKDTKILEKLETHYDGSYNHVDINPSFNNDGFLISLIGADGLRYVTILDYNMNMQTDPIQCDDFIAYDNGTCLIDTTIYDMKGNKLYSLSDKGYERAISVSDDIIFVCGYQSNVQIDKDYFDNKGKKCNFAALDKNGNVIFDKIDISNVVTKSIG